MITAYVPWGETAGVASSAVAEFAVPHLNCSCEMVPPGVHFHHQPKTEQKVTNTS